MNAAFTLNVPAEVLASARMTLDDIRLELAITLFRLDRLSMGKSAEFAGLSVGAFQSLLASRKIGPHYDAADALEDAESLAALPR